MRRGRRSWDFSAWSREGSERSYAHVLILHGKETRLFSEVPIDKGRVNRHKLKTRTFHLKHNETFFTAMMVKHKKPMTRQRPEQLALGELPKQVD